MGARDSGPEGLSHLYESGHLEVVRLARGHRLENGWRLKTVRGFESLCFRLRTASLNPPRRVTTGPHHDGVINHGTEESALESNPGAAWIYVRNVTLWVVNHRNGRSPLQGGQCRGQDARGIGSCPTLPFYQNWYMDRFQTPGFLGSTPRWGT